MCGRYALLANVDSLKSHFGLSAGISLVPRYNIAPGQSIPAISGSPRRLNFFTWGFVAAWAAKTPNAASFVNARLETISEKPYFRESFKRRRALVPVSGYYEWQVGAKYKRPYFISSSDMPLFGLAAIWENDTLAILTREAVPSLHAIHARMPVIIAPEAYAAWLHPKTTVAQALSLAQADPAIFLENYAVSTQINDPKRESSGCIYSISD
jgi:putative SOS response-associated peptidase YedK